MAKKRVLVIEDNEDTRKFLLHVLKNEFDTIEAENAVVGIDFARNQTPDLILLDIMLPHLNGLDACQLLKKDEKTARIPIIFLSAKTRTTDITDGLDIGADDYISKPFDHNELIARIKARLRVSDTNKVGGDQIVAGELKINPTNREVIYGDRDISLTLTEFDILRCLLISLGEVVSRKDIMEFVWSKSKKKINDRTIDVHIRSIRMKIPEVSKFLSSVYGVGYRYNR